MEIMRTVTSDKAASAETIVATLNALFDIYADERSIYDRVFVEGGYLNVLKQVQSKVKSMVSCYIQARDRCK